MRWSAHFESILNMVNVGVHVVDKKGMTVYYNETMAIIDGLEPNNVIGKTIFQLYPSLTVETSTLNLALKRGIETVEVMQTYVNMKGKHITTINSTYPLTEDGEIIGAVETAKDITRVVRMYDQTLELQKQLFDTKKKERISPSTAVYHFSDLIGDSSNFRHAIAIAKKAARTTSPVLIYGATGTGKELVAQSIHNASSRHHQPFIALNCAAVPKELMEGLMFGTTKGAFTGAVDKQGIFEQANGGTLFLDELNSLDLLLQAKLLRVLQDRKIRRIGGKTEKEMDVRIITAMNIPPEQALQQKVLRSDLYFRLNVLHIELPTLKQRKVDIPILVEHFIKKFNDTFMTNVKNISDDALQHLLQYDWPGNIRELSHAIERAFNIIDYQYETIEKDHLPTSIFQQSPFPQVEGPTRFIATTANMSLPHLIEKFERDTIIRVFNECNKNISKTANALGVKRQALQYKLNKYQIRK